MRVIMGYDVDDETVFVYEGPEEVLGLYPNLEEPQNIYWFAEISTSGNPTVGDLLAAFQKNIRGITNEPEEVVEEPEIFDTAGMRVFYVDVDGVVVPCLFPNDWDHENGYQRFIHFYARAVDVLDDPFEDVETENPEPSNVDEVELRKWALETLASARLCGSVRDLLTQANHVVDYVKGDNNDRS